MKFYIAFLFWVAAAPASYAQSMKAKTTKAPKDAGMSKAPAKAKAKATKAPKDASMKKAKTTKAPAKAKANKAVFNL
jgi:hypothetical protein